MTRPRVEIKPVIDAVGLLDELYPGVPADAWEPYRERYPDLFAATKWRVPVICLRLRAEDRTILVDTGIGPPGLWDWDAEWRAA